MSEHLDRALEAGKHALGDLWGIGNDDRIFARAVIAALLEDIRWDDVIEQEAQRLFKNNERERGGVRPQVITPEDSMDYWTMVATIAEIRRRAGIEEGGQ